MPRQPGTGWFGMVSAETSYLGSMWLFILQQTTLVLFTANLDKDQRKNSHGWALVLSLEMSHLTSAVFYLLKQVTGQPRFKGKGNWLWLYPLMGELQIHITVNMDTGKSKGWWPLSTSLLVSVWTDICWGSQRRKAPERVREAGAWSNF